MSNHPIIRKLPFHYGWVIAASGMATIFIGLGLGRFALGMLLPAMGEALTLDYARMGYVSAGNFIGYLAAVAIAAPLMRRFPARWLISFSLILTAGGMILVSRAESYEATLLLYLITGIGSGLVNIPVMALASHWFKPSLRGLASGIIVAGSGLGIIFAGFSVPAFNDTFQDAGWRMSWVLFGLLGAGAALLMALLLRDHPEEVGLSPLGQEAAPRPGSDAPSRAPERPLLKLGLIYSLFGATYVIFVTFIVTSMIEDRGLTEAAAGKLWAWSGFLSLFSGPLFGWISDRLGRRAGLALVFGLQACAYALAALPWGHEALFTSLVLFGLTAFSTPAIMSAAVGDYLGRAGVASGFATVTLFFGVGQVVGPAAAGYLAQQGGGFAISFGLAAALAAFAVNLSLMLRPPGSP